MRNPLNCEVMSLSAMSFSNSQGITAPGGITTDSPSRANPSQKRYLSWWQMWTNSTFRQRRLQYYLRRPMLNLANGSYQDQSFGVRSPVPRGSLGLCRTVKRTQRSPHPPRVWHFINGSLKQEPCFCVRADLP